MKPTKRVGAILLAFFVTILWSTSWVLIKINLQDIPPLTFAGLRYTLAAVVLMPGLIKYKTQVKALSKADWLRLIVLGLVFYAVTQGGMFLALNFLDAITLSLLLNFTAALVAVFGIFTLREIPKPLQWLGIAIFIIGALVYFYPLADLKGQTLGFVFAGLTVVGNAIASLMGRSINRDKLAHPVVVTAVSMMVGALIMLGTGLAVEDFPALSFTNIAVIFWLAVVNTALAFSIWNRTLQTMTAVETSIINNTMLIQIAVLAWIFLDERLSWVDIVGLSLAAVGVLLAHIRPRPTTIAPE
jgi:drug/metabolite transporter (DMT)-like permease